MGKTGEKRKSETHSCFLPKKPIQIPKTCYFHPNKPHQHLPPTGGRGRGGGGHHPSPLIIIYNLLPQRPFTLSKKACIISEKISELQQRLKIKQTHFHYLPCPQQTPCFKSLPSLTHPTCFISNKMDLNFFKIKRERKSNLISSNHSK